MLSKLFRTLTNLFHAMSFFIHDLKERFFASEDETTSTKRRYNPLGQAFGGGPMRLEEKCVPATYWVNSLGDTNEGIITNPGTGDGQGTLRWCIKQANSNEGHDTIRFIFLSEITLTSALDNITESLTISAPADNSVSTDPLTISPPAGTSVKIARSLAQGTPEFRIFTVNQGVNFIIENVTIMHGSDGHGGAISSSGSLTITGCEFYYNSAQMGGGAIRSLGVCSISASKFFNNTAGGALGGWGGAIEIGGAASICCSLFEDNWAGSSGGAIHISQQTTQPPFVTIDSTRITYNSAPEGGGIYISGDDTIVNLFYSTIDYNSAESGGGIHLRSGAIVFQGSLIRGNTGTIEGGGIYFRQGIILIQVAPLIEYNDAPPNKGDGMLQVFGGTDIQGIIFFTDDAHVIQ